MLDHFSRWKLSDPKTGELRLATSICKALERLCVELDVPIYLNSTCQSPDHKTLAVGYLRTFRRTFKKSWSAAFEHGTGACVK